MNRPCGKFMGTQKCTVPQARSSSAPTVRANLAPIAFVSGPSDADQAYFGAHYIPPLNEAISKRHNFIVGTSRGVDAFTLDHLLKSGVPASRIRLYLNTSEETTLKPIFRRFEEIGGSLVMIKGGHPERDEAMTRGSHYDILQFRTEDECRALYGQLHVKGVDRTEMNHLRRKSGVGLTWSNGSSGTMTSKEGMSSIPNGP